jgi:hypothetical protein
MVSLVSTDGMHQLHIFVFFLAVFHVTFSFFTMSLGRAKVWWALVLSWFVFLKAIMDKSCKLAITLIFCFYSDAYMEGVGKGNMLTNLRIPLRYCTALFPFGLDVVSHAIYIPICQNYYAV